MFDINRTRNMEKPFTQVDLPVVVQTRRRRSQRHGCHDDAFDDGSLSYLLTRLR